MNTQLSLLRDSTLSHPPGQHAPPKDVDGLLVGVDGHLVVKDQLWTPHGVSVVCDQRPALGHDVVHVEVTLQPVQQPVKSNSGNCLVYRP